MADEQVGDPRVGIIMGSSSDWPTMQLAAERLTEFGVTYRARVVSAHRTPHLIPSFATEAESDGMQVIIAGAGGAAHLPGMMAAHTYLPVLGVPIQSKALQGLDSLLSIVQMPDGIPVGTLAIGNAGARNAAMMAIAILALHDSKLQQQLMAYRQSLVARIENEELPG
ncbi:MAG: 5-(carboxyamino)imidazole ribonucleotide mutase [Phycisphaerae bacterium]